MYNLISAWSQNFSFNKCSCNRSYSQLKLICISFSFSSLRYNFYSSPTTAQVIMFGFTVIV